MNRHAKLIEQYCQDWLETHIPWERWEVKGENRDNWVPLSDHPRFYEKSEYRRKPRTILINGIEVPEPEREPLAKGEQYFLAELAYTDSIDYVVWDNDGYDLMWLNKGLIHLTEEAAKKHAEALLSFTKQP